MLSSDGFDGGRCGFFAAVHGRTMEGSRWAAAWRGARKPGRRPRMAVFIAASKEVARREAVSRPRRLVPWWPQTSGAWGWRSACRFAAVVWPVLVAGCSFENHHRAKALPWLPSRAGDGDAPGRRFLLEDVVEVMYLASLPGFSGGNPRSHAGSGEGGAIASLAS